MKRRIGVFVLFAGGALTILGRPASAQDFEIVSRLTLPLVASNGRVGNTPTPTPTPRPVPTPATVCRNLVADPSFESHAVPAAGLILRPPMPGWTEPLPDNGSYVVTNLLSSAGNNALAMTTEFDKSYSLAHQSFNTIDPSTLVSASISLDIWLARDFDFDVDVFNALLVNSAFPDCPGELTDCFELLGPTSTTGFRRVTADARNAVTRRDWDGFFLMLLMGENHITDSSLGLVDDINFEVCQRGGKIINQATSGARHFGSEDIRQLREAVSRP